MDKTKTSIDHRELLRKSYDKIRVNNPFNEDIVVRWDGFPHVIPHNGFAIKERYIAEKYLKEVAKRVLVQRNDKLRNDENARRTANGQGKMNRWQDEVTFESDLYTNWPNKQIGIIKELGLYGGIVEEYGLDYVPSEANQAPAVDPSTSIIEQLDKAVPTDPNLTVTQSQQEKANLTLEPVGTGGSGQVEEIPLPPAPSEPPKDPSIKPDLIDQLEAKTQPELRKIAKEKGLETHNTDKKADLIAAITA